MSATTHDADRSHAGQQKCAALLLGAVGVVYGDIGTSPLAAFREAHRPFAHDGGAPHEVIGLISLMIWTLTIIVTFKYVNILYHSHTAQFQIETKNFFPISPTITPN